MPDPVPEPLRTNEPPAPVPPPPARRSGEGYTVCEFCGCQLAPDGQIITMADKARTFRDEKENNMKANAKRDEEIAELKRLVAAKDAEIAALKGSAGEKRPASFL